MSVTSAGVNIVKITMGIEGGIISPMVAELAVTAAAQAGE